MYERDYWTLIQIRTINTMQIMEKMVMECKLINTWKLNFIERIPQFFVQIERSAGSVPLP